MIWCWENSPCNLAVYEEKVRLFYSVCKAFSMPLFCVVPSYITMNTFCALVTPLC